MGGGSLIAGLAVVAFVLGPATHRQGAARYAPTRVQVRTDKAQPGTQVLFDASPGEVLDRIVAVVSGQAITLSDVRAASELGLLPPTDGSGGSTPAPDALLDRLIDRELMRAEIGRFSMPPAATEQVTARLEAIRSRFLDAGAFAQALDRVGMSEERLRTWIDDDDRIDRYVEQRFGAAAQPTDEETLRYFQSREREFLRDGVARPFEDVQDEVRAALVVSRREALVRDWVSSLRRRATITLPGRP